MVLAQHFTNRGRCIQPLFVLMSDKLRDLRETDGEQRDVRGGGEGSLGQSVRVEMGAWRVGVEFLQELHSLCTSGYIWRRQRRGKTGTDKREECVWGGEAVKTKS